MTALPRSRTPLVAFLLTAATSFLPWLTKSDRAPSGAPPPAAATAPTAPGAATGAAALPAPAAAPAPAPAPAVPAAEGPVHLDARMDRALLPVTPGGAEAWLVVSLEPLRRRTAAARLPVNLAIVLDVSGSMAGSKLAEAKRAATELVAGLDAGDRAALVAYEAKVDVKVPSTAVDAAGRDRLLAAIAALRVHGETNIHDALLAGRDEVLRFAAPGLTNRIVLLSDGKATVGPVRTADGLAALARTIYDAGVAVTSVGVGLDAKVDLLMAVSRRGGGAYHYVEKDTALAAVFADELRAAGTVVARAPWVDLTPAPGVEVLEFVGHDAEPVASPGVVRWRVRPGDLYAAVDRKIVVRLRVPAGAVGAAAVASVMLGYREASAAETAHLAAAAVRTTIVADAAASEASRDPKATERVVAAELARDLDAAADLHAKGDRRGAVERLDAARKRFEDEAALGHVSRKPVSLAGGVLDRLKAAGAAPDSYSAKRFYNDSRTAAYEEAF